MATLNIEKPITYEIRPYDDHVYELVSIVPTDFGGDAVNYVFSGTFEECNTVKRKLENGE